VSDRERWNHKKDGPEYAKESGACSDVDFFSIYADMPRMPNRSALNPSQVSSLQPS
jgi:hypothetical protein